MSRGVLLAALALAAAVSSVAAWRELSCSACGAASDEYWIRCPSCLGWATIS